MRPIDADALKEKIENTDFWDALDADVAETVVDNMPTLDVEPVRHGEWKDAGLGFMMLYACTHCGKQALFQNRPYPYCPNCGAKMDAKEENP